MIFHAAQTVSGEFSLHWKFFSRVSCYKLYIYIIIIIIIIVLFETVRPHVTWSPGHFVHLLKKLLLIKLFGKNFSEHSNIINIYEP